MALSLDKSTHQKNSAKHEKDWFKRNATMMDMELDDDGTTKADPDDDDDDRANATRILRLDLAEALKDPLLQNGNKHGGLITTSLLGLPSHSDLVKNTLKKIRI